MKLGKERKFGKRCPDHCTEGDLRDVGRFLLNLRSYLRLAARERLRALGVRLALHLEEALGELRLDVGLLRGERVRVGHRVGHRYRRLRLRARRRRLRVRLGHLRESSSEISRRTLPQGMFPCWTNGVDELGQNYAWLQSSTNQPQDITAGYIPLLDQWGRTFMASPSSALARSAERVAASAAVALALASVLASAYAFSALALRWRRVSSSAPMAASACCASATACRASANEDWSICVAISAIRTCARANDIRRGGIFPRWEPMA
eukprot:1181662-Prorocentrum_minimum.AAC.2